MSLTLFDGLWWLLLLLGPLVLMQRRLHFETQAVFLLITRRGEIAVALFAILFFPGVMLHELSHFLMARLLGVRTVRFSLLPRPTHDGRLQLGYVETVSSDWLRDSLIGAAPLIAGGAFVAYTGLVQLGFGSLWVVFAQRSWAVLFDTLQVTFSRPDFWIWFYLTLAVSSTMFPSATDRRAWLPMLLFSTGILGLALLVGAGPWLFTNLSVPLNNLFRGAAAVLGVSLVVQGVLVLPLFLLRRMLNRLTRLEVG